MGRRRAARARELADVLRVVTATEGDCHARFSCLLDQVYASLDLDEACLDRLERITGPVNVRLPKTLKAPEGKGSGVEGSTPVTGSAAGCRDEYAACLVHSSRR